MAAAINFFAGKTAVSLAGSGLGFYGASFGTSVQVGQYQDSTYITSSDGSVQGPVANNTKKLATTSGVRWNDTFDTELTSIQNASGALNVRFTFDTPVKTQNAQLRVFDRVSKNNNPSGVTCYVGELIHPWEGWDCAGSGDATWVNAYGSGSYLDLVSSPGVDGNRPSGADTQATQHDWYVAISASPNSIGSKTQFGLYVELEYL